MLALAVWISVAAIVRPITGDKGPPCFLWANVLSGLPSSLPCTVYSRFFFCIQKDPVFDPGPALALTVGCGPGLSLASTTGFQHLSS
jgi:hypothetical protein